ncbi:MAG: hypothetical protein WCJ49_05365 [Deltaproteobacteria bacterium]
MKLPALLAVTKEINEYRLPTITGIISAKEKEIMELCANDCVCSICDLKQMGHTGSPTKVLGNIVATAPKNKNL